MDLDAARRFIDPAALFAFTRKHAQELLFPDQDLLNMLYGERVLALDDAVWNYDARNYSNYYLRSGGDCDMDWVFTHTAVLHFCGKAKPWKRRLSPPLRPPVQALHAPDRAGAAGIIPDKSKPPPGCAFRTMPGGDFCFNPIKRLRPACGEHGGAAADAAYPEFPAG